MIGIVSTLCVSALFDIHHRLHALKEDEDRARNVVRLASAVRDQYAHAHPVDLRAAAGDTGRVVLLIDQPTPTAVNVEVHDTGGGMRAKVREHVFEPFFTTRPAGSGLGLAISRAIARAHGGDIIVASTTPRGSDFRLTLPTASGEQTA